MRCGRSRSMQRAAWDVMGPIIRVSEANLAKAEEELKKQDTLIRHSAIINPIQEPAWNFFQAGFPVWG